MSRNRLLVAVACLCASTLTASPDVRAEGQAQAELRLGTTAPLWPQNPLVPGTVWARLVPSGAVHAPLLTTAHRNGAPAPAVIRAWCYGDSGRALGLSLARGFHWHDGPPVTAGDIAFTVHYLAAQHRHPFLARYLARADSLAADSLVLRFSESVAVHSVAWLVGVPALPRHVWQGVARADTLNGERAILGCGPFRFGGLEQDERGAVLVRADSFPGAVHLDGVRLAYRGTAESLLVDLRGGRLDALATLGQPLPPTLVAPLTRAAGGLHLLSAPYTGVPHTIFFGYRSEFGGMRAFRAAVAAALDFDSLARALASPLARRPGPGLTPTGSWSAAPIEGVRRFDPAGAQAGLGSLGLVDRDGDGFREGPNGLPLTLEISAEEHSRPAAEQVARALGAVGLRARTRVVGRTPEAGKPWPAADFVLAVGGLSPLSAGLAGYPDLADDPPFARGTLRDAEYSRSVDQALHAPDELSHMAALASLQAYAAEQTPAVALTWDELLIPVSDQRFTGWSAAAGEGVPHWRLWTRLAPVAQPPQSRLPGPTTVVTAVLAVVMGALVLVFMLTRGLTPRRGTAAAVPMWKWVWERLGPGGGK